jgi:hypothetical protein
MCFQSIEMCGDLCDFGSELCGLVGSSGVRFKEIPMFLAESLEFTFEFCDVISSALAQCALGVAVLCSSALGLLLAWSLRGFVDN